MTMSAIKLLRIKAVDAEREPHMDDFVGDLCKIVERSKCEEAVFEAGSWSYGWWIDDRCVAQKAFLQSNQLL